MSRKAETERLAGPRRHVRYTRLLETWPECPATLDPTKAILEAPADAALEAMAQEVEHYRELLQEERDRANKLEVEHNGIRLAARVIAELIQAEAPPE